MPDPVRSNPPIRSLRARLGASAVVLGWLATLLVVCSVKYRNFLYTDFDLAIFAQGLFGALHGRWFSSVRGMYWLGDHSSLLLLGLAPIAAFWRSALLLPVAQAIALALAALPLFAYARRRLGDETAAAAFAAVWVLQPALAYLALFEFHPETLATPALLGAAAALAASRPRAAAAWAIVAALAREDVALPLAVLGAVAMLRPGPSRSAGLALVAIAAGSLALSFGLLKPLLAHGEADYGTMYARWGRGPAQILAHFARDPGGALGALWSTPGEAADTLAKREYWLHLLGPVLGTALFAPLALLPAAPVIAEHLLSSRIEQHTVFYQYTALVLPFVAIAAVNGVARLSRGRVPAARALVGALVLASACAQLAFGPFTQSPLLRAQEPEERAWPDGRDRALAAQRRRMQDRLPAAGVLVVDFPSLAPLASRDSLHSLHHVAVGRYTFSSREYPAPPRAAAMLCDLGALDALGEIDDRGLARLRHFAATRGLRVTDTAGDLVLLEPGADTLAWLEPLRELPDAPDPGSRARATRFDGAIELLGATLDAESVEPGGLLPVATTWRRVGPLEGAPLVQWTLAGPGGTLRDDEPRRLGYGLTDVTAWPAGPAYVEHYRWVVPADLPPGEYVLSLSLWRHGPAGDVPATPDDPAVRKAEGLVEVGRFRVGS